MKHFIVEALHFFTGAEGTFNCGQTFVLQMNEKVGKPIQQIGENQTSIGDSGQ